MRAEATGALISESYAAALDSEAWQRLVDTAAGEYEGCCFAIAIRRDRQAADIVAHAGYPPGAIKSYLAEHAVLCPWNEVMAEGRPGIPYAIEDTVALSSISYSRFYKEWIVPYDLGAAFGVKLWETPDLGASLLVHCAVRTAVALREELLALLAQMAPHMRRSIDLSRRYRAAYEAGVQSGATRSQVATTVIESNMTVVTMNEAMEQLVGRGLCALSAGRKLRLHKPDDSAQLAAVLQEAVKGRRTLPWPHVMAFHVPGQTGPNIIEARPLDLAGSLDPLIAANPFAGRSRSPAFIVTMRVRCLLQGPSLEHIRIGLGLTPKQAHAVWSLVNGESIEKQAQDRGLSIDGVRWHFKNIYQRTGCSNQAELVRLVVSLFSPETA